MVEKGRKLGRHEEVVAFETSQLLLRLHRDAGIPLEVVLASAHGQVATMLAAVMGGEFAYERCLSAAEHVRPMLSLSDAALAAATPHGKA